MALRKSLHTGNLISDFGILIVFIWLMMLTYMGNLFGQLGLGVSLVVAGIWTLARSKSIWEEYRKAWKKLPKAKKNVWNEPKESYYYLNMIIIMPMLIVNGLLLILLAYYRGI